MREYELFFIYLPFFIQEKQGFHGEGFCEFVRQTKEQTSWGVNRKRLLCFVPDMLSARGLFPIYPLQTVTN